MASDDDAHERTPPTETVADWARRTQREKEAAMTPAERILLALRLGLRARAIARLAQR